MTFIAKNPIVSPQTSSPPVPPPNTRGIFPKDDGWYEIDDKGNINKLGSGSQDSDLEYSTLNLGVAHSGQAGIIKHEITAGTPKNLGTSTAPNGIITLDRTSPFPKVVGTSGILKSSGDLKIKVDELFSFGDEAEINCESYTVKKFSDDVVLLSSWLYSYTRIAANVNGGFWEFRIPISALGEIPAVTTTDSVAALLNSAFEVKSESAIRAMTTFAWNSFAISFSYDDNNDYATVLIAQRYPYTTIAEAKRAVDKSQLSIKYLLKDFVYKYNTDKLYLNQGESVSYEPDSNSANYKTLILKAPKNNRASLDMLEPVTENINALNYKVENIKVSSVSNGIGKGDGLTDDTAALQNAINAAKTSSGALKAVTIPTGKYLISSPLILDSSNFTLKGDGEVILEAADKSYRKPIIVVKAHDITIENITIHLGYCDDDPQFTKGYNKLTDTDSDINSNPSEGLHCGIWLDTANTYNHLTENESLNPYLGYYRTKIKDCRIIGGYRYSVKKLERSYGIYMPDSGFQYFSDLQGVELFNLYCGIRLGNKSSSLKVDFHFDHDINGRGGANSTNCGGCRFGLINYGSYTYITCMGQLMGGDFMPPIYYDSNGNEHLMTDSTKVTKPLYDTSTLKQTSITTTDGWQDNIMEYCKLSEIGMVIFGSNNRIHSMIFDVQRSDKGLIFFGVNSKYNDLFLVSGVQNNLYGANETTYYGESYYRPVTVDGVNYFDIVKYNVHQPVVTDLGIHNHRSENPIENRTIPFIGDSGIYARDDNGNASKIFATSFGMQDNFLSFVDKWWQVKVTQGDKEISEFITEGDQMNTIGEVFDTNSNLLQGFSTGITFKEIPTESSPITIDIDFGKAFPAPTAGFIQFNKFIAKKFSVCLINSAGTEMLKCNVSNNHNAIAYYKPYNITNGSQIKNSGCCGMRIKIYAGLTWNNADSDGVSNPNGKVGISYIYMSNSNAGGMSYLPREEGKTTVIDRNSKDTQYPSAKAVYDELVKKLNADEAVGKKTEHGGEVFNVFENDVYPDNTASGKYSHAEGLLTTASGDHSHAEGRETFAKGYSSHAEGEGTKAGGYCSHTEGSGTATSAEYTHAEGFATKASCECQHVQGRRNKEDTENKYAHIVGNGTDYDKRSNAHTLDWDGNAWYQGDIRIGGTSYDDGKTVETKTTISTSTETTASITLADNTEVRCGELTSLTVTLPETLSDSFISSVVFKSGATATTVTVPSEVYCQGADCKNGAFLPKANKRYTMIFSYDGIMNCYIAAVPIQTSETQSEDVTEDEVTVANDETVEETTEIANEEPESEPNEVI